MSERSSSLKESEAGVNHSPQLQNAIKDADIVKTHRRASARISTENTIPLPLVSLFCGAGGLDHGFHQAGFSTILAYDSSVAAVNTYNLNHPGSVARCADLSKMTPKKLIAAMESSVLKAKPVGVIGGPPCQGFSCGNAFANPDDERNALPFKFARLLKALNERYSIDFFVFENVMGLMAHKHLPRFKRIRSAFQRAGFTLYQQTLNARDFGVAQVRHRLFLVGLNTKIYNGSTFEFPNGTPERPTVRDIISGLPSPTFFLRGMTAPANAHHPNHWTMMPKSPKFQTGQYSLGRSFKRLAWDAPSPTVAYGNREVHIHPDGGRRLSVYEAMLLQGFPSRYRLSGHLSDQITQVSNAVPPPLARALAEHIKELVYGQRCSTLANLLTQTGVADERFSSCRETASSIY